MAHKQKLLTKAAMKPGLAALATKYPRPSVLRRLGSQLSGSLSLFVWLGTIAAITWLAGTRAPQGLAVGYASEVTHSLSAETAGRIVALNVKARDTVEKGQLLASLDNADVLLRLQAAKASIEQLRAEITAAREQKSNDRQSGKSEIVKDLRRFSREVEDTRIDYLRRLAIREEDHMRLAGLGGELERQRGLLTRGLESESRLTNLSTLHAALKTRIKESGPVIAALSKKIDQAQARLAAYEKTTRGSSLNMDIMLRPKQWAITAQETELERIQLERTRLSLRAPASGIVTMLNLREGEVVAAGDAILTILEPSPREIVAFVDEQAALRISSGQAAVVTRASDRQAFPTQVLALGSKVEQFPLRSTGQGMPIRYGVPVYLRCPGDAHARSGEAFHVQFVHVPE